MLVGSIKGCQQSVVLSENISGMFSFKSEAMVLGRKPVDCPLQVGNESLPQVKEIKYLRVLLSSEGTMEREMGRRIGAAGAVLQSLYRTVVTKRELSQKAKLSVYRAIFVPTLTYGHEGLYHLASDNPFRFH